MFSELKLKSKLYLGFGIILSLTVISGIYSVVQMRTIADRYEYLVNRQMEAASEASDMRAWTAVEIKATRDAIIGYASPRDVQSTVREFDEARDKAGRHRQKLRNAEQNGILADTQKKALRDYDREHETLAGCWDKVKRVLLNGSAATNVADLLRGKDQRILETTANLVRGLKEQASKSAQESKAAAGRAAMLTLVGIGIILTLALGVAAFVTSSTTRQLRAVLTDLGDALDRQASSAVEVSSANRGLAQSVSEQAASIEEASSSLEEMASMTARSAENAQEANNLMMETSGVIAEANESMMSLTESMNEISAASDKTARIVKTIDEISFQTNLLALNAAVEAARAGAAGAGFAVVAEEVRNLARRAAEAAKSTAALIDDTLKKIGRGADLVGRTSTGFMAVAEQNLKVCDLISEIVTASQEQSQGISQINTAVAEMDKVVQRNSANAEETASATEELNSQTESLREIVGRLSTLVGAAEEIAEYDDEPDLPGPGGHDTGTMIPALTKKLTLTLKDESVTRVK